MVFSLQSHSTISLSSNEHMPVFDLSNCNMETIRDSMIAGYAAGVSGTIVGHPFDTVKVWMQTGTTAGNLRSQHHHQQQQQQQAIKLQPLPPKLQVSSSAVASGTRSAVASFSTYAAGAAVADASSLSLRETCERARLLYSGVGVPLFTVGLVQSINFAVYDSSRRVLFYLHQQEQHYQQHGHYGGGGVELDHSLDYRSKDSLWNVGVASAISGSILACITSPMLIVKTKQQTQQVSFLQALRETVCGTTSSSAAATSSSSLRPCWSSMYAGFGPHFLCETMGRVVYFVTYEYFKRALVEQRAEAAATADLNSKIRMQAQHSTTTSATTDLLPLSQRMLCAATSGVLCWLVIFPVDALRCRLFAQTTAAAAASQHSHQQHHRLSTWQMMQRVYCEQGWRGFYRGFTVTVIRAGPVAAAVLPIYDMTLDYLSNKQHQH